jgi:uncharacterized protein (DUF488 family)
MHQVIYTIGHSTHTVEHFVGLLKRHSITALCDVRSKPYSRNNPQFNREDLKDTLREMGIVYVFLGKELGARSEDSSCYDHDRVQYDRLAQTDLFRKGLDRVCQGAQNYCVALMCAEKEPLDCHRTILVARHVQALGFEVQHIHADGRLETHLDALQRLIRTLNLPEHDMFRSHEDIVADAYRLQADRIAYERDTSSDIRRIAG